MTPESKRVIITVGRWVVFAGLIILGAWILLTSLKVAIPTSVIDMMSLQMGEAGIELPSDPAEWDWSNSLWTAKPVAESIGERLGHTVQLIVLGGLLGLAIAAVLLFLGRIISQVTDRPTWLAQVRRVLRLLMVSGGVSIPIFVGATLLFVFGAIKWGWSPAIPGPSPSWWEIFFISLLPMWLLVQVGHGELAKWPKKLTVPYRALVRDLSIRLVTTLLKLTGALIALAVLVELIFDGPGMGRLFTTAVFTRDYPLAFGIVWVFVLIVVLVKLAADLIEVAYNHFSKRLASSKPGVEQTAPPARIPKGWLIFSLVLVFASIIFAVVGPSFAPYPDKEIHLTDSLAPPSAEYPLGTDQLGRDLYSRLLFGFRTTLAAPAMMVVPGLLVASAGWDIPGAYTWAIPLCILGLVVFAIGWAVLAAYLRKKHNWLGDTLEDLVMLPRDILCAFPWLVLPMLLMSMVGRGLTQVTLVGGLVLLPHAVGMMREAYSSPPASRGWLYSVLWSIPVMVLLSVAGGILYTSSLSFLGLGIPPPWPEFGALLSFESRRYMFEAPWLAIWPSICLSLLSFVWIMAGDALLERLGFRSKAVWLKAVE